MNETESVVEIPKGDPETLRSVASRYEGIEQALRASETQLMKAPLSLGSWQGPASIAYARVAAEHAAAVRQHHGSVQAARVATNDYADALADAREAARAARADEREALQRIATLKAEIADEEDNQAAAAAEITAATLELTVDAISGGGAGGAQDRIARAKEALEASQERERRLRVKLAEQREALASARRRGARAVEQAGAAAVAYAAGMEAAAGVPPMVAAVGTPARVLGGGQHTALRRPRNVKAQPTSPSAPDSDPFFNPISALGWGITGATAGYVHRAKGVHLVRRAAAERLTHASNPSHKLTETGYSRALREAERGMAKSSAAARAASKGLSAAKIAGPAADVATGVYDTASGRKGALRSGIETRREHRRRIHRRLRSGIAEHPVRARRLRGRRHRGHRWEHRR